MDATTFGSPLKRMAADRGIGLPVEGAQVSESYIELKLYLIEVVVWRVPFPLLGMPVDALATMVGLMSAQFSKPLVASKLKSHISFATNLRGRRISSPNNNH